MCHARTLPILQTGNGNTSFKTQPTLRNQDLTTAADNLQVIVPYCERLVTGGETINVVSNVGFLIVAIYGWRLCNGYWARQTLSSEETASSGTNPQSVLAMRLLILLLMMIAVGSTLFHASPGHVTHMLDIVPVCLFSLLAMWLCLARYNWPRKKTSALLVIWIAATAVASGWPEILAHSLFYLPTLAVLVYLAYALKPQRKTLALLSMVFATALLFRALDLPLCALGDRPWAGAVGTHFLWHGLTALACVLCLHLALKGPQEE